MNGGAKNSEELEMLSPANSTTQSTFSIPLKSDSAGEYETEEDDDVFTEEMISFAEKADHDHKIIKDLLRSEPDSEIFINEEGVRLDFLKNPTAWMNGNTSHTRTFPEDDNYIGYVVGLLEIIVNSSPYGEDRDDIYSPILLLQKIVTVSALKERRDPMRSALKLQHHLQEYASKENNSNSIYDRRIEALEQIPRNFAVMLMKACRTPVEVTKLMRLDDETMFLDVLKSNNMRLVASKMYQKVVWQRFWGSESSSKKNGSKLVKTLYAVKRLLSFFFWNFFYLPLAVLSRCTSRVEQRRKRRDVFFSPFSSYLADLLNYTILLALLLIVTLTTVPNPNSVHLLIHQLQEGNITTYNNPQFRVEGDGSISVRLPTPIIPPTEWALWTCIFSRVLTEWYQAYRKKGSSAAVKLRKYINSFSNLNDIVLMFLLITGMVCKLHMFISCRLSGVFHPIDHKRMVSRRLIVTIYFYSTAAVMALVRLLQVSTIHVPGLGPLLRAIRAMFSEISRVLFLFIFFILGFIIPMLSLVSCYRAVHGIDGIDDQDDFYSFGTATNTVLTLVWSMFGGLAYNHKENLYDSQDGITTVFMSFLLVLYAVLLGLMCMNLLIAIMCSAYSKVNADKFADWRFSQFESIMDYNAVTNEGHGMPFLFPFCIPYIVFNLIIKPCKKRRLRKRKTERAGDNHFARFLCQYRKIELEDSSTSSESEQETETELSDSTNHSSRRNKIKRMVEHVKVKAHNDGNYGGQ